MSKLIFIFVFNEKTPLNQYTVNRNDNFFPDFLISFSQIRSVDDRKHFLDSIAPADPCPGMD
jgi:hypothetical protein